MIKARAIPCLLLKDQGLVKTVKFGSPTYIGDPLNAVRIYNEKEVDELIFLDITATNEKREPNYDLIGKIAQECFMPFSYGGGVRSVEAIKKLLRLGVEKVILNTATHENPQLLREAAKSLGSSTVIAAMDIKRSLFGGYKRYIRSGTRAVPGDLVECAKMLEEQGAGELFINSIDRDGVMGGYDVEIISRITNSVGIPVIACGGAGNLEHVKELIQKTNVSAAAAGSIFVYHGRIKGVLINYPKRSELDEINSIQDRRVGGEV
ncbi:MAG: imidazole glycerol phosphate synthase subunit HisF [Deltaproteobacteria bacterium]|nr:imidazole glycerol phosphate synthase subunit HisF [Deltaproteobacteria bacterium]